MSTSLFSFFRSLSGALTPVSGCSQNRFSEIKYFHPQGESMKDGVYIYKGFFLGECAKNSRSFFLNPCFKENHDKKGKCKGGVILFPESMAISTNEMARKVNSYFSTLRKHRKTIPDLKSEVNKSFFGSYISPSGFTFGSQSITIEVCGIGNKELLRMADSLFNELKTGCVVVRDFNRDKFYCKEI